MYTCMGGACTLLSLAALTNTRRRRLTKPQIYERRSKGSASRGRGAGRSPNKKRGQHMVNHSASRTCSALIKPNTALIFQSSSHWSTRCAAIVPGHDECLALKEHNKRNTGWRTLQECNNKETGTIFCKRNKKKKVSLKITTDKNT